MRPVPLESSSRPTLAYRPELDGIRGLAILAVLAQHVGLPSTTWSGMVGVNLFFVLSGFLITSLLVAEHDRTGRIDLRAFYERRIRRLVPALAAVLLATAVVMALQGRIAEYLGQAGAAVFYVANIAKSVGFDLGYVGHTWSLAQEEQFYLLWPAAIVLLPRRWLVPGIMVGIVASVAMQLLTKDDLLAYFRPDVRADAILWGCLLALAPVRLPAVVAGLCAIGLVLVAFGDAWPYAYGLASVLSVGLVAGAASLSRLLSARFLVRIGEISYGLYLWHLLPATMLWPVTQSGNVGAMVVVLVLSFGLALASERWIERPFRHPRRQPVSGFASEPEPEAQALPQPQPST
jgi:peptidoglycan/LPS O-acetylase OafA/YrhL